MMPDQAHTPLDNLQSAELAPFVAQALAMPDIKVLGWHVQHLPGGATEHYGSALGVYRVSGTGYAHAEQHLWTLVVKIVKGADPAEGDNPADSGYWKREVLAYQSGLLDHLPPCGLVAPRCYGVTEQPNGEWRMWLEDVHETVPVWSLERHGLAKRHLGQFNGTYLAGYPLPIEQGWMLQGGITRDWLEGSVSRIESLSAYSQTNSGRRWLNSAGIERISALWAKRHALLRALDGLPRCFCHHDAFRRNLFARDSAPDVTQTVAIDWAYVGYGGVGQEAGSALGGDLVFLEIPAHQAKTFDEIVFSSYVEGLRDAGWRGDVRLPRFGYAAAAALDFCISWTCLMSVMLATDEEVRTMELVIGRTIDEIIAQYAEVEPFLLDLGDEALNLLDEIGSA